MSYVFLLSWMGEYLYPVYFGGGFAFCKLRL